MQDSNQAVIAVIRKLEKYQKKGYMDSFEIGEVIDDIKQAYSKENQYRLNKMMEEVTSYMSAVSYYSQGINEYVRNHISEISRLLNCSPRTVYRRLQNDSFTLIEKQMIEKEMIQNAEHK